MFVLRDIFLPGRFTTLHQDERRPFFCSGWSHEQQGGNVCFGQWTSVRDYYIPKCSKGPILYLPQTARPFSATIGQGHTYSTRPIKSQARRPQHSLLLWWPFNSVAIGPLWWSTLSDPDPALGLGASASTNKHSHWLSLSSKSSSEPPWIPTKAVLSCDYRKSTWSLEEVIAPAGHIYRQ